MDILLIKIFVTLIAILFLLIRLSDWDKIKPETVKHKLLTGGMIIVFIGAFLLFVLVSAGKVQNRQQEESQIENRQRPLSFNPDTEKEVKNEKNN
jgi:hypothetical protein